MMDVVKSSSFFTTKGELLLSPEVFGMLCDKGMKNQLQFMYKTTSIYTFMR